MILQTIFTIVNLKARRASRAKTGSIAVGIYRNFSFFLPPWQKQKSHEKGLFFTAFLRSWIKTLGFRTMASVRLQL